MERKTTVHNLGKNNRVIVLRATMISFSRLNKVVVCRASVPFRNLRIKNPKITHFNDDRSFATNITTTNNNKSALDFSDAKKSFQSKSTISLILSYSVFTACTFDPLVRNADKLIALSYQCFGRTITDTIIKATFFRQFCGGESPADLKPTIQILNKSGINGILDYAAENAPDEETTTTTTTTTAVTGAAGTTTKTNQPARTFWYQNEEQCDHHVDIFKACILAVKDVTPNGFAALKITALGDPILLERMSTCISECYKLMEVFDTNNDGVVTVEEFTENYHKYFVDATEKLPGLIARLDPTNTGQINYIEWSKLVQPEDVPRLVQSCRDTGPLSTPDDLIALANAKRRLDEVAQVAFDNNVRLLIDAGKSIIANKDWILFEYVSSSQSSYSSSVSSSFVIGSR